MRRYAAASKNPEQRGLAYFVLGYREYETGAYSAAVQDLRLATETKFSLVHLAQYYWGAAASKANESAQVTHALNGFPFRYPESPWRFEGLALLARELIRAGEPDRALQVLTAAPGVRQRPSLALLLAQAYWRAPRLQEAARAYQEVYYAFPTAPESVVAGEALRELKTQLGPAYPFVPEEIQTARLEMLFRASRFDEALREYNQLLSAEPASPFAWRWKLERARCQLRLKRTDEVIPELEAGTAADAEMDARRLELLVEAYAQSRDDAAIFRALGQLRASYPQSGAYASALFLVGNSLWRRGDWVTAARYYESLAKLFPEGYQGTEASWRLAWAYYLTKEEGKARQAFVDHIARYPTSPHRAAGLYWLGRLEEDNGRFTEARALYNLLQKRFAHNYYASQATARLKAMPAQPSAAQGSKDSRPALVIAELIQRIPPLEPPPLRPCGADAPSEVLRPFLTLRALSLDNLGEEYLRGVLADRPDTPDLLLALSKLELEQGNYSAALFTARKILPDYSAYDFSGLPRDFWDLLYPRGFWNLVKREARAQGLDPYLIMGLIRQESAFNPRATSRANARGLMQILPQTASRSPRRRRAVARKLYDPAYNLRLGCRYLRGLVKGFAGNLEQALAAYHAGDSRVKEWIAQRVFREPAEFVETIPIGDTRIYVKSVLRDVAIYRGLMTGSAEFAICEPRTAPETKESGPGKQGPGKRGDNRRAARPTHRPS